MIEEKSKRGAEGIGEAGTPGKERELVSVIIPAYNYARFLPEAVDSALAQTWRPLEIIVIDDGSTDATPELMASRYGDEPLLRYVRKENQGLSAARNTGITEARGEFLVFLDADDRLLPEIVETSKNTLDRLGDDFALVASCSRLIDSEGDHLPDRSHFGEKDIEVSTVDLLVMNRFGCVVLARRSAFEACGRFDPDLVASEDRDMWLRLSYRYRLYRLGAVGFEIRRHGDNMSGSGCRQALAMARVLAKAGEAGALRGWRRIFWLKVWAHYGYQRALLESSNSLAVALFRLAASCVLWPVFSDWRALGQKRPWFRLRTMGWLLFRQERKGRVVPLAEIAPPPKS